MWSAVTKVGQLLGLSRPEPQVDWDAVAAVLDAEDETHHSDLEDDVKVDNTVEGQVACQHRTGVITELYQTHGYITSASSGEEGENRPLYFQLKNAPENLKVGNRVVFLAFRLAEDSDWVVRKVLYVDNERWDDKNEDEEEDNTQQSVVKEECETAYKHVIGKITGRKGRTVFAEDVQFSLDSVEIDFIPVEGDWVSLSSLVQPQSEGDTVLMVDRVSPLRSCTREGQVSHWTPDCQLGIVDGEVVFSKDACEPGYLPRVGDQVTVYCIESDQGQLTWRAVQVVATSEKAIQSSQDQTLTSLLQDKQGIVISENTNFGIVSLGQEKDIKIDISNEGASPQTLIGVEKTNRESQFQLPPFSFPLPTTLQPHDTLHVTSKVQGRFVGRSSELLRFHFEGFEIGRQLAVDVQSASLTTSLAESRKSGYKQTEQKPLTVRKLLATRNGFIVPGVRPIKPANFVPVHLGRFTIPEELERIALGSDKAVRTYEVIAELLKKYPSLAGSLNGQNYIDRWDKVIHVEEVAHRANISRYDTTAALHRVDEYLSLEIPGLAERRPSLMVGDTVIARPSWTDANSWATDNNTVAYEGFIHKVLSNEVLLKFNPTFHDTCSGVYSINFESNRTSFRRLHQAVHVGHKNLCAEWLFPSKVTYQPPQVIIVDEANHNSVGATIKSESNTDNNINHKNSSHISEAIDIDCDNNISNGGDNAQGIAKEESAIQNSLEKSVNEIDNTTQEFSKNTGTNQNGLDKSVIETFISSEQSIEDSVNSAINNVNNVDSSKTNRSKNKRQKSRVSDMFEKLPLKDEIPKVSSPPRVSVVDRFLQNGNCHSIEKGSKEMDDVFRRIMGLKVPKRKTEMKTLEEIEKTLLSHSNVLKEDIKPLPSAEDKKSTQTIEETQGCNKKKNLSEEINQNQSSKEQKKEKNTRAKNIENQSSRQKKEQKIKWNSNTEMKLGIEKESVSNIPLWKRTKIRWFNPLLNHHQKEAVRNILKGEARPLPYVIFGPPGTGKTITVVEAILQIYFLIPDSRLLVATPSNSAADLVCERLLQSGLLAAGDLLRLCSFHYADQGRVPDSLRPYCGTADIKARDEQRMPVPNHVQEGVVNISRHAIGRHRVTVGTCGALAVLYQMGFPKGHFTHVVVDEAGQATEPEILIPLVFLHKSHGQAILAGDPLQLGPVVISSVAEHFGLGESFLSRLLQRSLYCRDVVGFPSTGGYNPHLVTRLVYNYRSLPEILQLPNNMFYHGDLIPKVSDVTSEEAEILDRLRSLLPTREDQSPPALVFHGVRGTNCQSQESPSWYNPHEAVQTTLYLQSLYNAGLTPDQCGIITPYQAQVLKIRSLLETLEVEPPKVGSVEEFQGQERMVVILSTVRSSPRLVETDLRHSVGFVCSPRRLNVAITRARACLIVLGNPHLLARDQYWRTVLRDCVSRGGYTGCDLPADLDKQ
ncbi:probable RNA helicase armi [Macrosteles quadrilineatus]|uniref:probable RNA helicase armi n=1 Tax=Macrosteles quadrilineatus TaxID=74068 RepID=UPI0023E33DCC|nr:probable RNA helicase armi [Macrosteles quadrilineatus]XP_054285813.1 probable RNA helicase armi [Macrosteles quadrilineatus]